LENPKGENGKEGKFQRKGNVTPTLGGGVGWFYLLVPRSGI
jgi:hypothetical protein